MNKYTYKVDGMNCHSCEILIKEGLLKIPGIKYVEVSQHRGEVFIEHDGEKLSTEKLNEIFKDEKFIFSDIAPQEPAKTEMMDKAIQSVVPEMPIKNVKEHIYKVEGMHCASCEILIEKKLLDIPNIKSVDASAPNGEVVVEYEGDRPNPDRLSRIFAEEKYRFYDQNQKPKEKNGTATGMGASPTLVAFNIAIFIIVAFLILGKMGIANFLSLTTTSSIIAFFGFGILAGLSSCAALVGGIVLSMSKQWSSLYAENSSTTVKLQPHIMFNVGRVISYAVLGGILGMIGSKLQISLEFTAFLIIAISFLMLAFGLQMLGVKAFSRFQIAAPKSATRYIANENNFQGKHMPFIMGALTFFLPCGFTITAQSLALLSGSAFSGALMMGAFALGTAPVLLAIGLSSVKFSAKPHLAERFSKVAGFLLIFFALFNFSNQINVLGFTGIDFNSSNQGQTQAVNNKVDQKDLPPIVDGKQVIKMTAYGAKDVPNYFKVQVGVPVRWEITADASAGGCNGSIISRSLFSGSIDLIPGQVSVKEFTPEKTGKFRFSCQMGMITGTIEVVNAGSSASSNNVAVAAESASASEEVIPSGASGCGCGGGGGNTCGGAK